MINAIIWDVTPQIFQFRGFEVRWYGLLFAGGFIFGYIIMGKIFKKENIPTSMLDTITTYMVVGTVLGARLGHCLFYQPDYYLANPIEILKIWEGGLASHGAAIGILFAVYLFSRKVNKPYMWIADRLAIVVALAGFFIRIGNLMNSEIYGIKTNLPWGFIFVHWGETMPKHPTQIYEALSYLLIFFLLYSIYRKQGKKLVHGYLFGLFMALLFGVRFLIEFIKETQVGFEEKMFLNMGQLLSIPLIILGIYFIIRARRIMKKES